MSATTELGQRGAWSQAQTNPGPGAVVRRPDRAGTRKPAVSQAREAFRLHETGSLELRPDPSGVRAADDRAVPRQSEAGPRIDELHVEKVRSAEPRPVLSVRRPQDEAVAGDRPGTPAVERGDAGDGRSQLDPEGLAVARAQ